LVDALITKLLFNLSFSGFLAEIQSVDSISIWLMFVVSVIMILSRLTGKALKRSNFSTFAKKVHKRIKC